MNVQVDLKATMMKETKVNFRTCPVVQPLSAAKALTLTYLVDIL